MSPELQATLERDPDILVADGLANRFGISLIAALSLIKTGRELERKSPEFSTKRS